MSRRLVQHGSGAIDADHRYAPSVMKVPREQPGAAAEIRGGAKGNAMASHELLERAAQPAKKRNADGVVVRVRERAVGWRSPQR